MWEIGYNNLYWLVGWLVVLIVYLEIKYMFFLIFVLFYNKIERYNSFLYNILYFYYIIKI